MSKETVEMKENVAAAEAEMATSLITVEETMEKMIDAASVDKVYGKPIEKGNTLIIPAAEVMTGMGMGSGFGMGKARQAGEEQEAEEGGGGGAGGGGRIQSRPVAVVVASDGDVHIEPVIDKTKLGLTAIIANGILGFTLLRLFRRR